MGARPSPKSENIFMSEEQAIDILEKAMIQLPPTAEETVPKPLFGWIR